MSEINELVCPRCGAQLAVRFDQVGWRVTCMLCENSFDFEAAVRKHALNRADRAQPVAANANTR